MNKLMNRSINELCLFGGRLGKSLAKGLGALGLILSILNVDKTFAADPKKRLQDRSQSIEFADGLVEGAETSMGSWSVVTGKDQRYLRGRIYEKAMGIDQEMQRGLQQLPYE